MIHRFLSGLMLCLVATLACSVKQAEISARFFVFGTLVDVVVRDSSQATADAAFAEIQQRLQAMHNELHAWEPGPLLQLNQALKEGNAGPVTPDIEALIVMSQTMEQQTGGKFNAATGALVGMWGFHTSHYPVTTPPPSVEELQKTLSAKPSAADITIKDHHAVSGNPLVQLDFGGIAKGYAVDQVAAILRSHGITRFIVNAGGDLRAVGGTEQHPWRVGVQGPEQVLGGIEIKGDAAVFTSGAGQRYRQHGNERYPHILDPRTGFPVTGLFSVTVISGDGWFADAAATALMVAGPGEWQQVSADLGLDSVLVIEENGDVFATEAMIFRLMAEKQILASIVPVTLPGGQTEEN